MKNIIILGSTGSIGTQTLEVVEKLQDKFNILGLACGTNIKLIKEQINKFNPKYVCLQNQKDADNLKKEYKNIEFFYGEKGLLDLAKIPNYDTLVVATSGIVSVKAVLEAIENKKTIALANKETLVMAGDIVMKKAIQNKVSILPIDSEHSAILQCLNKIDNPYAQNLWITASGGPFRNNSREEMKNFSSQEALKHPRWMMGKKITIDCATLVNKGLEVIEAHHLYNFDYKNIKVVIHPQSIVHSFVEFKDGSFLAQMGVPSMHIPIQYALTYPERHEGIKTNSFNIFNKNLEFFEPDYEKFPLLKLTIDCGKTGGLMPVILNAANEVAVHKFINNEIKFLDIEKIVFNEVESANNIANPTLEEIFETDKKIRMKLS
ncbi:1-deoxy-D-xylulose-5-phosphate reductoisomerase [bacterium]|nr:1-deoxy-D-xylulose-5-phosphate reductoisomerase [bacterium]MBQ9149657.1 1-deoxy-D-xylulose-5-phosphate reductoisomerase [bacterium]